MSTITWPGLIFKAPITSGTFSPCTRSGASRDLIHSSAERLPSWAAAGRATHRTQTASKRRTGTEIFRKFTNGFYLGFRIALSRATVRRWATGPLQFCAEGPDELSRKTGLHGTLRRPQLAQPEMQ